MIVTLQDAERLLKMPMAPRTTRFEVSAGEVAAWVFAPPPQALPAEPLVLDLYSGWPHSRHYWHFVPSWDDGSYSFAQYLVEHSRCVVIASDDLGLGDSTRLDGRALTLDALAEVRAQVADAIRVQVAGGTLISELPPLPSTRLIGIGHGTGALVLHRVQAAFAPYDAVAFLGWTHGAPHLGLVDRAALEAALAPDEQGYAALPPLERQALRHCFYRPDVAEMLIDLDERQEAALPGGLVGDLFRPGAARADAGTITTHIFLGYGAQDLSRTPSEEASCYPHAASVTTCIQPETAHVHHLAPTRQRMWNDLGLWMARLVAQDFQREARKEPIA